MEPPGLKRNSSPTLLDSMSTPSSLPSLTDDEEDDRLDSIHYPQTFTQDASETDDPCTDVNKSLQVQSETTSDFEDTVNKDDHQTDAPENSSPIEELASQDEITEKTGDEIIHMTSTGNSTIEQSTWLAKSGQLLSPPHSDVGKSENCQQLASCQTGKTETEAGNLLDGDKTQQELISESSCHHPDLSPKEPVKKDVVYQPEVQDKLHQSNLEENELTSQEERKEEPNLQSKQLTPKRSSTSEDLNLPTKRDPSQAACHTTSTSKKPENRQEVLSTKTDNHQSPSTSKKSLINPFRRMIRQVGKILSNSDVDEMMYLTEQSQELLKEKEYQERPFLYLMTTLEKQGKVTESKLDLLVECLEELQCEEAIQLVESYKMSVSSEQVKNTDRQQESKEDDHPSDQPRIIEERQEGHDSKTPETRLLRSSGRTSDMLNRERKTLSCSWEDAFPMLQEFGIEKGNGHLFNIMDCMTIDQIHLNIDKTSVQRVVMTFLSRIMSFDHRAMKVFKDLYCNWYHFSSRQNHLSCRDIMFCFLNKCDPFLRQEILSKMAACQVAVPVLLPNIKHTSIALLVWGLQKIKKVWLDRKSANVQEQVVTKFPFPVVAFLRFGHTGWSKSNILNKMLGSIQGNDDHPYFTSNEQDRRPSLISHGSLEAVWYHSRAGDDRMFSLTEPLCFLNLRGDANELSEQQHFIRKYSLVIIAFVSQVDLPQAKPKIASLSEESNVIVAVNNLPGYSYFATEECDRNPQVNLSRKVKQLDLTGLSTLEISEILCAEIKQILSLPDRKPCLPLEESVAFCDTHGLHADILVKECREAMETAEDILRLTSKGAKQFKQDALPLQNIWLKWSQLDKDRTWKGTQSNTERQIARLHNEKQNQRRRQCQVGVSAEMKKLYEELSRSSAANYRKFLVFWLQHYLNELSLSTLRPLINNLKEVSYKSRETAAEITQLKRRISSSSLTDNHRNAIDNKIKEITSRESKLHEELSKLTKEFDACSLGFEHFIREFGQIYECFHNNQVPGDDNLPVCPFDVNSLPRLAADLLLSGQPLEIFDGDACHVPIKWVTGVLKAIRDATQNSRIYVISVIGIQSSGKSTLLNSMFGVRFAVSAGRCTRGVFLQLLPLSDAVKRSLQCDFIAVIDTEGLKAPEKALTNRKNEDNELATFALCISDMTLINIGGQTVGEDLSNILQISAHAFIRMKEVHLRSSCYLIQQFVADITAHYRNQSSTQSILQKLDQAVVTAAIEERKQDQYRQFSDCFDIVNIGTETDRVQYMPSLWRASMSAPNHEYSEIVLKLKSELLQEIKEKNRKQTVSEFSNRIVSVWKAVKQEDFVFNFRNTNEIAQYNNFSRWYQKELLKLTQGMLKWELEAKSKIKNTAAENIRDCQEILYKQLKETVDLEVERIQCAMDETLQNGEHESVKNHANYFSRDLNNQGHQIHETVRKALNREVSFIINAKTKDNEFLPAIKAKLRRQVFPLAENLQLTLPQNDDPNISPDLSSEIENTVKEAFEEEWTRQMRDVQLQRPTRSAEEIRNWIESDIEACIVECLKNTDLSKEMKQLLETYTLDGLCQTSPTVRCSEDISQVWLTRACSRTLTQHLEYLRAIVQDAVTQNNFCFSNQFLHNLRKALIPIILDPCPGCQERTDMILCVLCHVLQEANEATERTALTKIMKSKNLMEKLNLRGVPTQWNIQRDVNLRLKNEEPKIAGGVIYKMKHWVGDMFWNNGAEMEENFYNQVQTQFLENSERNNKKRWYSVAETNSFVKKIIQLIKDCNVPKRKHQELLAETCSFFIRQAVESETNFVRDNLSWEEAQVVMNMGPLSIITQRDFLLQTLEDALPDLVINGLRRMSDNTIRKYASVPLTEDVRHAIDDNLISLIPGLDTSKYGTILSVTQDSRNIFLGLIQESAVYSPSVGRALVTSTLEEITNNTDLGKLEQAVTIACVCSWALPICIDMTITFEQNHSIQALLEEEKELLYSDFKSLCNGACQDQLAARSLCAIVKTALQEALKNRLCGSLFERLCTTGNEIFCSRPRFLQTALEQMCEEESFGNYTDFLCHHNSFIKKWTLQFIAKECCCMSADRVRIKDVALNEIGKLLLETEESFTTALRSVQENGVEGDELDAWMDTFIEALQNSITCTLNEDKIAQLYTYHDITDFSVLTKECVKIIKTFQGDVLLDCLHLPDMSSTDSIAAWFQNHLPKQLHALLANSVQGCGSQCPFCKTFCDDTVKEHKVHFSNLHFPTGIGGMKNRRTRHLGHSTCVANVATEKKAYYNCGCHRKCDHPSNLFKNYKKDYPDWDIHPVSDYEPTIYWKWVLSRFNQDFATYYRCKTAQIPWGVIAKHDAMSSIRQIYSLGVQNE